MTEQEYEFITIPEFARRTGVSKETVYRQARLGEILGLVRIGRRMQVNWVYFVEASKLPMTPAA